jgi:hypothetical protein
MFFLTREVPATGWRPAEKRVAFADYLSRTFRHILVNRNFLFFLGGDTEYFIIVTVISFYANYATLYCGVAPPVAAGIFVMFVYIGSIITNIICGTMGMFSLKNKFILSKMIALIAISMLILGKSTMNFFIVSALIGANRGIRNISYAPAVKRLSGLSDSTGYFAVAPLLTLPFAIMLPVVAGWSIDGFSHLEADAYRIVFAATGLLMMGSMICVWKADFNHLGIECAESEIQPQEKSGIEPVDNDRETD